MNNTVFNQMTTPAKFNNIDLDITHYDTDELLTMFNLTDPTEDDIMNATTRLINKAIADRLPKVVAFFQDAQDTLLDELENGQQEEEQQEEGQQEEEQQEEGQQEEGQQEEGQQEEGQGQEDNKGSDQLGQWWRNQYLKQTDKVQSDKPADRKNKIQVLQGNHHMPIKRDKLGINETYQVPVAQGTLNPNLKNTVTRLINIDSQYRQIITPNSENPLGPASPTNYTIDLTENLTNVLSIKLNSIQIPYTWYAIDITSGTNLLFYKKTTDTQYTPFMVLPGNYTPSQLQTYMSGVAPFVSNPFTIAYNSNSGKITITNTDASNAYEILFFEPTYHVDYTVPPGMNAQDINTAIAASKVNSNLGWLMGFRGTNQVPALPNQLLYTVPPTSSITTEALTDTYGPKYLILVLDDYNQNHLNKGLVNIATNDTKLSLPSYFTPGQNIALPPSYFAPGAIPVICDTSGNPTYVQSNPRKLTQAQIYTINTIQQDRNNTAIDRYTGPTTTDVLALIPVKTYSLLPGQPYIEFGSSLQTNERVYFGPVNIERMKIQLVDDKGNILNMHGNDWSITIISTHLYEY